MYNYAEILTVRLNAVDTRRKHQHATMTAITKLKHRVMVMHDCCAEIVHHKKTER